MKFTYNSTEVLAWSKKESKKAFEEAKTAAKENKEEFEKMSKEFYAKAFEEGNFEDYLEKFAEMNPEMAAKFAKYHESNLSDMINDPEKYLEELR